MNGFAYNHQALGRLKGVQTAYFILLFAPECRHEFSCRLVSFAAGACCACGVAALARRLCEAGLARFAQPWRGCGGCCAFAGGFMGAACRIGQRPTCRPDLSFARHQPDYLDAGRARCFMAGHVDAAALHLAFARLEQSEYYQLECIGFIAAGYHNKCAYPLRWPQTAAEYFYLYFCKWVSGCGSGHAGNGCVIIGLAASSFGVSG